ncbi:MAG: SpoIIIAH-like family protein [Bacilli bacterium]|nr:SpoIIIAH-like family protein [Bacilli bacterium]
MINKKSLWFLTLFSLILVLSIYYITMPSELLLNNSANVKTETKIQDNQEADNKVNVAVEESDLLVALRVESDSELQKELETLKNVLTDDKTNTEEKNEAFEKIKKLNNNRSEEEQLEKKVQDEFKLKAFIKIDGDQIKVTVESNQPDNALANKIMRSIQNNYQTNKYISVKFQK